MNTLKVFWANLSKVQKVGVIVLLQLIVVVSLVLLVQSVLRPKEHVNIVNKDESGINVPEKNMNDFKENLWYLVSGTVEGVDRSVLDDVVIREGSYEEANTDVGKQATFIVDIDSIKQSYKVTIAWVTDKKSNLYDDMVIDCPPLNEMKYKETVCHGMYNDTYSLELYLPYIVTADESEDTRDIYIDGNENEHTIFVEITACDGFDELKKQAMDYLESTPIDLSKYTIKYNESSISARCGGSY